MNTTIYERTAQSRILDFADLQGAVHPPSAAQECMECEAMLYAGIDAYRAIELADMKLREAALDEVIELPEDFEEQVRSQVRKWLKPVGGVLARAKQSAGNGYDVPNLDAFEACVTDARSIVGFDGDAPMPRGIKDLEQEALREHERGETADYFSSDESND